MFIYLHFSVEQLSKLKSDLRGSNLASYAEGTRKNLKVQWQAFVMFCIYFGFTFLPASTSTVQLYAQFLSRSFKSVSSSSVHLLLGFDLEKLNAFLINFSFHGMMRLKGHTVKKAESVTPALLCNIFHFLDFSDSDNLAFWCLFLFAFFWWLESQI